MSSVRDSKGVPLPEITSDRVETSHTIIIKYHILGRPSGDWMKIKSKSEVVIADFLHWVCLK